MTPREKVLRDGIAEVRAQVGHGLRAFIDRIIAAADAIPDAPVAAPHAVDRHAACCVNCALKQLEPPVPSRAELIELMRSAWDESVWPRERMDEVLDALIKSGAVKL